MSAAVAPAGSGRLSGFDVARLVAMLLMAIAHFATPAPDGRGAATRVIEFTDGRAMSLFCVLAGASVGFLGRRGRPLGTLAGRAVVLITLGIVLEGHVPAYVILHYYALFLLLAGLVHAVSDRTLIALAGLCAAAGALTTLVLAPRLGGMRADLGLEPGLELVRHPIAFARELTVTGAYPLLPSFAFVLVGLWASRRALDRPDIALRLLVIAASTALALALLSNGLDHLGPRAGEPAGAAWRSYGAWDLANDHGHRNMPLWVLGASAWSLTVIAGASLLAARAPRLAAPLARAGRLALTFYVVHLVLRRVWTSFPVSPGAALAATVLVVVTYVAIANAWLRVADQGPLEAVLRAAGRLTERATTQP